MTLIVRARGDARDIQHSAPGEPLPPGFVVYNGGALSTDDEGIFQYENIEDPPYIRPSTQGEINAKKTIPGGAEFRRKRKLKRATDSQKLDYLLRKS